MNCFSCIRFLWNWEKNDDDEPSSDEASRSAELRGIQNQSITGECSNPRVHEAHNRIQSFTMDEIFDMAKDSLKKGDSKSIFYVFGRLDIMVLKGKLKSKKKWVSITQLPHGSVQGREEFMSIINNLSFVNHPNIDNLIGYCREGRILVHEHMPSGTLDYCFLLVRLQPWNIKVKIAAGIASGLHYLICELNPPIIYSNLRSSNILMGMGYNPKLSLHGFENIGHTDDENIWGTYRKHGYDAPEFSSHGELTEKSNVYSLGVMLKEMLEGRRTDRLDDWELPRLPKRTIYGRTSYPPEAILLAYRCMRKEAENRPSIIEVVRTLSEWESKSNDGM